MFFAITSQNKNFTLAVTIFIPDMLPKQYNMNFKQTILMSFFPTVLHYILSLICCSFFKNEVKTSAPLQRSDAYNLFLFHLSLRLAKVLQWTYKPKKANKVIAQPTSITKNGKQDLVPRSLLAKTTESALCARSRIQPRTFVNPSPGCRTTWRPSML
jgi:hypothetical protein